MGLLDCFWPCFGRQLSRRPSSADGPHYHQTTRIISRLPVLLEKLNHSNVIVSAGSFGYRDEPGKHGALDLGVAGDIIEDEGTHAFLSSLELDMSDAKKISHILASEQTSAIERSDFLLGCKRMRGGASGVDLARTQMEQEWLHNAMLPNKMLLHKITRLLSAERLASQSIRNSRVIQKQMSETSSGWNPGIDDFNRDEPVVEARFEETDDIQIHAIQRSNLQSWQQAVTMKELLTIRSDLPRVCHGWRSERSHHLMLEKFNLYDFVSRLLTDNQASSAAGSEHPPVFDYSSDTKCVFDPLEVGGGGLLKCSTKQG
ncbi:Scn8a [Symbiodinium sp. CCMP2592]|nr:Scn8a [Symbiodinium sp. CCMP2592]